jgi:hypothetical protein
MKSSIATASIAGDLDEKLTAISGAGFGGVEIFEQDFITFGQASSDAFQEEYAKAEATYRSARALVFESWGDVKETLDRGDRLSVRQYTLLRLAMAHVTWASHAVSEFVYKTAGTTALRSGTIQRLFRDMHAGTQHVVASPPVYRAVGRELAGLAEGHTWVFVDLVARG